jgi:hypothetical protein
MNRENQPLLTDEVMSLRNSRLKFKTLKNITDHSRGIYGIYLKLMKEKPNDHNM